MWRARITHEEYITIIKEIKESRESSNCGETSGESILSPTYENYEDRVRENVAEVRSSDLMV